MRERRAAWAAEAAGVVAAATVDGATDGDAFRAFVDRCLVPALRPGQVVLMDNLTLRGLDQLTFPWRRGDHRWPC